MEYAGGGMKQRGGKMMVRIEKGKGSKKQTVTSETSVATRETKKRRVSPPCRMDSDHHFLGTAI